MENVMNYEKLVEKWAPVLNEESAGTIKDHHRKAVTAQILENQEQALKEQGLLEVTNTNAAVTGGPGQANWDPILIALVRRAMPNLVAYDIAGVQPMTGPTGLIFAMKSRYKKTKGGAIDGEEALFNEPLANFSGDSSTQSFNTSGGTSGLGDSAGDNSDGDSTIDDSDTDPRGNIDPYSTAEAEALGGTTEKFAEMGFTIEKATVTAKSRALKAEYSLELAQDLKAIHGLDAETELANILSTEILAEINREVVRTVNSQAKLGAETNNTAVNGVFNIQTDADGRWSVEKFKGLILQIEREANTIAKQTRRGKGNLMICSSDVASALAAAGMLDYTPALATNLNVDDTGNTFAGTLNGRMRVYIDPFATGDYANIGYKGTNAFDAGLFYCPYVPLTMVRAVGEDTFQPKIGFKTRYGMVSNPFVTATPQDGLAAARNNQYYRIFRVDNILGA
tara:strand:- start:2882 stop:4237 length:1356 start_codon:yes stop_codon:yes gene_type:complete